MMIRRVMGALSAFALAAPLFAQCEPAEVQRVQPPDVSLLSFFGNAVAMSGPAGAPADRLGFVPDGELRSLGELPEVLL